MGILNSIKKVFSASETTEQIEHTDATQKELPESFYIDTIEFNRVEKDQFFRSNPYSPIEDRVNFKGLDYYPPDPNYRYTLPLNKAEQPEPLTFQTSTGDERTYYRLGTVEFEVEDQPAQLSIYRSEDHDELFLPFRDATSGSETYGAGRYLEPEVLADGKILVDFNLCYSPFCAYSDAYSCPLPPFENHLTDVAIRAGEKAFEKQA
jgi:uncharacterized protein (DUF1684 family)